MSEITKEGLIIIIILLLITLIVVCIKFSNIKCRKKSKQTYYEII